MLCIIVGRGVPVKDMYVYTYYVVMKEYIVTGSYGGRHQQLHVQLETAVVKREGIGCSEQFEESTDGDKC